MGAGEQISGLLVSLDALSKGLGGVGINAQAITGRLTTLYQSFVALSVVTNTTGKEMDALAARTLQISKQMGYTQESVISMQKTLMVGFQKPIDDVDTFNNLLARSEQLFGRNEESASRFIDTLARQSKEMSSLRDLTLEISNVQGRAAKEGRELNARELQDVKALQGASEATLRAKLVMGKIDIEQYNTSMRLISQKKEDQSNVLNGAKAFNEIQQKQLAYTVAEGNALFELSGSRIAQKGLEYATTGGSQLGAKAVNSITDQLKTYEDTRKNVGNKSVDTNEQEVLKSFAADAVKNTGAANAAAAIEEINKKLKEQNILQDLSAEDLKKQVGVLLQSKEVNEALTANQVRLNGSINDQTGKIEKTVSLEEKRNNTLARSSALMQTMLDNANAQVTALNASIGALSTIGTLAGLAGQPIDASKYGLDPKKMISDAAAASSALDAVAKSYEAEAAMAKAMNANAAKSQGQLVEDAKALAEGSAASIIAIEEALAVATTDVQRKQLQESKKAKQEQADEFRSLGKKAEAGDPAALQELQSKINSAGKAGSETEAEASKMRQQSIEISLSAQQRLNEAVLAGDEQHLKNLNSEYQKIQAQISLMDSLAVGIGANAAARQQAAQNLIEQVRVVKEEEEKVLALKAEYEAREAKAVKGSQDQQIAAAGRQQAQNQYNDLKTKEVNLTKQALDMTQRLREGYLDAIQAMESGAGVFTEIVVNQDKNLGSLIRTTAEVPRVLRTGAGAGGLTQSTGFGPGGITGGSDPRSPEYGKSVLTNFEQINQLMAELPKQIGEETGKNLAIAAGARPEYGSVIMGGTSPGSAGTVTVGTGGGATTSGGGGKAGSVTVETGAIAETITKGMVSAVEIGVRNALSVLEKKTA